MVGCLIKFLREKMNNAIKTLSNAYICYYKLKVTLRRHVVVTIEISTFNNYRTAFAATIET